MFANKLVICTFLLLLSSAVHSQTLFSFKNGTIIAPVDGQDIVPSSSSSSSTSTSTTTTTTTTSTVKPNSSTTSSTSTSTSTSTETPKTTTTPAPVPSTTQAPPQPYPAPTAGTWNASCILLTMAGQFNFSYTTKDGNKTYGLANIPKNATIGDHTCDPIAQMIQLSWGPSSSVHSFLMRFETKNSSSVLTQILVSFTINNNEYPDAKENQTIQLQRRSVDDLKTPEKMSYHCTRPQHFNMTETYDSQKTIGVVMLSQLQVEAFRQANATGFSSVHDCDSSETSDIVPIAVGIALVALILVVLISYLCARRRSTSRGYMSF